MNVVSASQINIPKNRLRNVLTLHQEFVERMVAQGTPPSGLERSFAEYIRVSPSFWSQIKSGRTIGNKLAQQIENATQKPSGWMNGVHPETAPDPSEEKFIALCRQAWNQASKQERQGMAKTMREAAAKGSAQG